MIYYHRQLLYIIYMSVCELIQSVTDPLQFLVDLLLEVFDVEEVILFIILLEVELLVSLPIVEGKSLFKFDAVEDTVSVDELSSDLNS